MPEYIGDRYELGPLVAVQGKAGCEDPHCRRQPGAFWCMGYHCSRCGEPCSMMGHRDCPALDPRSAPDPCDFCGSSAVERGDAGLLLGCVDCGYERRS